jgi:hypothetical protein
MTLAVHKIGPFFIHYAQHECVINSIHYDKQVSFVY